MLLTCNIGNTNINIGLFKQDELLFHANLATTRERSSDEYAILINGLLSMHGISASDIAGIALSSVVRPLNDIILSAVKKLTDIRPLLVGPGVKTGLNIKTDIPSQLGADIVANSVAASEIASVPLVVLALGTATTLTGINVDGELCGVMICPGVSSSVDALSAHAAELPRVALEKPGKLLGKNTIESMVSGVINGHAAMIEGLLQRISEAWSADHLTVVATGEHAEKIIPYIKSEHRIIFEPYLTLIGLKKIYHLSRKRKI